MDNFMKVDKFPWWLLPLWLVVWALYGVSRFTLWLLGLWVCKLGVKSMVERGLNLRDYPQPNAFPKWLWLWDSSVSTTPEPWWWTSTETDIEAKEKGDEYAVWFWRADAPVQAAAPTAGCGRTPHQTRAGCVPAAGLPLQSRLAGAAPRRVVCPLLKLLIQARHRPHPAERFWGSGLHAPGSGSSFR